MGCQDLLEEVPGRSRRDKDISSSPGDLRSFVKGVTGRSSSKSYSVKDETSSKFHTQGKSEVVSHFWDCYPLSKYVGNTKTERFESCVSLMCVVSAQHDHFRSTKNGDLTVTREHGAFSDFKETKSATQVH